MLQFCCTAGRRVHGYVRFFCAVVQRARVGIVPHRFTHSHEEVQVLVVVRHRTAETRHVVAFFAVGASFVVIGSFCCSSCHQGPSMIGLTGHDWRPVVILVHDLVSGAVRFLRQ